MVGRTPEFLGKKIRATQMKLIVAYVLAIPVVVLAFASTSLLINAGTSSILNPGMHGLTEVAYAYASVAQNNGSAFAGLAANTPWYDITLGITMLIGRFAPIVLALAIAGSLAGARTHARTRATLDTSGLTFAAFLRRDRDRRRPHPLPDAHPRPDRETNSGLTPVRLAQVSREAWSATLRPALGGAIGYRS